MPKIPRHGSISPPTYAGSLSNLLPSADLTQTLTNKSTPNSPLPFPSPTRTSGRRSTRLRFSARTSNPRMSNTTNSRQVRASRKVTLPVRLQTSPDTNRKAPAKWIVSTLMSLITHTRLINKSPTITPMRLTIPSAQTRSSLQPSIHHGKASPGAQLLVLRFLAATNRPRHQR